MRHYLLVSLLLVLVSCTADSTVNYDSTSNVRSEDISLKIPSAALIAQVEDTEYQSLSKASRAESNVYTFADMSLVGSSKLVRNGSGVTMTLKTTELDPGNAYTIWWVVFDKPGMCDGDCGEDEVFALDPLHPADVSVLGPAAGHVVGNNGKAGFGGHLSVDDASNVLAPWSANGGLDKPMLAEVHLVVRDHGPAIPGRIPEQIGSFGGGCDVSVCEDEQFAIHLSPAL